MNTSMYTELQARTFEPRPDAGGVAALADTALPGAVVLARGALAEEPLGVASACGVQGTGSDCVQTFHRVSFQGVGNEVLNFPGVQSA